MLGRRRIVEIKGWAADYIDMLAPGLSNSIPIAVR